MSRKSKRPSPKPTQLKQTLPLPEKVVVDHEFSRKGLTDQFHRTKGSRMVDLVLREVFLPGGNVYRERMTPEKVAIREKELKKYAESASSQGISVVPHIDIFAQRTADEPAKLWTLADRVPGGRTLHDLFIAQDPKAFEYQKRVMRAGADYALRAAKDESRGVVATDLLKPSQFVVSEDGSLTMIDTNPPLWGRSSGIDSTVSEIFMQGMAINVLRYDMESVDIGVEAITALADTGLVDGAVNARQNTLFAVQNYLPEHPQILLMQKVSLDLLLERPIG